MSKQSTSQSNVQLALLGGTAAVTEPWPVWPEYTDADRSGLVNVLESRKWWMYAHDTTELDTTSSVATISEVERAEKAFAQLHKVKHAIAVSSGSMALEICIRAMGLKPGDEVITTPYTFFATSLCLLNHGVWPVYVDIDPETYNIDPAKIEEAITPRTRAILPVHFAGQIVDMRAIQAIADRHGLLVLEDAAQAQGVNLQDGRYAGGIGLAGIFSLQASKCLTCGEGGLITTNDDAFAELAWSLRHYGRTPEGTWFEHHRQGWNARMTEFSASLLNTQMQLLVEQNARRMRNVAYFLKRLEEVEGIEPNAHHPDAAQQNHYLVILRYQPSQWDGLPRSRWIEAINAEGVPIMAGYSFPSYANPLFEKINSGEPGLPPFMVGDSPQQYSTLASSCPVTERACNTEALWLNHPLFLGDTTPVDAMIKAIQKVRRNLSSLL